MGNSGPVYSSRLAARFADLSRQGRAGLIPFIVAGDPDMDTSRRLLAGLPGAGADIIELGMPFSDPMADGRVIQEGSLRALKAGMTLKKILSMVADFRTHDEATPLILMGYYNPIHAYGVEAFVGAAASAGVDALIVVDLPPEESSDLAEASRGVGLDLICLTAPTSDAARLPVIVSRASGFIYHVSVRGTTGGKTPDQADIEADIDRLRRATDLPIAAGFGIAAPEQAAVVARLADAVVIGSVLVRLLGTGQPAQAADRVLSLLADFSQAVRTARDKRSERNDP